MNNFFEHKILVKYADGCLEKERTGIGLAMKLLEPLI